MAEEQRFELWRTFVLPVFKTGAISLSATLTELTSIPLVLWRFHRFVFASICKKQILVSNTILTL